jgi:hypothetical protein
MGKPPTLVMVLSLYLGVCSCWLYLEREAFTLVVGLESLVSTELLMGSCCPELWFVLCLKLIDPPLNLLLWTKITHDNMKLYWPTCSSFVIPEFICMLDWRKYIEQCKNAKHISTGILRSPSIIVNPLLLPSEKLSCLKGSSLL